jgi:hypothetical protein
MLFVTLTLLIAGTVAFAQDYPKMEATVDFSMINVHPGSALTSFNIFGGGGAFVYNVSPWIGIKADFQGYTQSSGNKQVANGVGSASGNTFTYLFGPQIKKHSGRFQPFGEALFGAATGNGYASFYNVDGVKSVSNTSTAFAMEFGGGLDIPVTTHIQIRPVEVDYLYTNFASNSQNNFKYNAGVNFVF